QHRLPVAQSPPGRADHGVRGQVEQPAAQFLFEAVHHRQDDDQRRDADRDPQQRDQRDERHEAAGPAGPQVAQADVEFERAKHGPALDHRGDADRIFSAAIGGIFALLLDRSATMPKTLYALAIAALLATVPAANADVLIIEKLAAASTEMPPRGLTMDRVQDRFGAPRSIAGPVGEPPITRWDYD